MSNQIRKNSEISKYQLLFRRKLAEKSKNYHNKPLSTECVPLTTAKILNFPAYCKNRTQKYGIRPFDYPKIKFFLGKKR